MIQLINVTHRYKNGTVALQDINLKIPDGEFLFIVGASGAGKSTLTKLLVREIKPTEGNVVVDGQNIERLKEREAAFYRRSIGFVYQDYKLLSDRTAFENVAFASECMGLSSREVKRRANKALEYVGLPDRAKHYPAELSGGEQQRVAIARAIVNKPKVIIADEPTGNLDMETAEEVMQCFTDIHETGTTIIMATHQEHLLDKYGDRSIRLADGRIIEVAEKGVIQ